MFELNGKYTSAKIFTDYCEESAQTQILELINNETFKNTKVRIMPDVHAGASCTIGFTSTLPQPLKIIPNLIGVDIGCRMTFANIGNIKIDFKSLDDFIKNEIPSGFKVRNNQDNTIFDECLKELKKEQPNLFE